MTETQKEQIYELRLKGGGYKSIGNALGLSRDSVKSYCKRHHLNGPEEILNLNVPIVKENHSLCLNCNTPIKQKARGRVRKFCSDECRREWWTTHQENRTRKKVAFYTFICSYCKQEFKVYGNSTRKYCGHRCYIKSRFGEAAEDENKDTIIGEKHNGI
jgi:predicted nucleic acid-binding Zn ribbon protein